MIFGLAAAGWGPGAGASETAALRQELAVQEGALGRADPALLPLLDRLATAEFRDGSWPAAIETRRRALRIALASAPDQSAAAMTALALLYIESQRILDAEPLLIAAERMLADQPGNTTRPLVLAGLARVAAARGEASEATRRAEQAHALAPDDPEILRASATALMAARRFDEAEKALARTLAIERERHGPESLDLARTLSLFATLCLREDRAEQALRQIEEATAIDQARLPDGHPLVGDDLHDLGLIYEALKRPDDALRTMRAAQTWIEHGAARDTPRAAYVESDLSRLYREAGDDVAAETALQNARRILNKAEAEEHRRERQV